MDLLYVLPAVAAFNLATSLAFANLYLKSGTSGFLFNIALAFIATNLALGAVGLLAGTIVAANLPHLTITAGAALAVVLGIKRMLKGWKTSVNQRFYDITNAKTRFALLTAINIDTLMLGIASAMIFSGKITPIFSLFTISVIFGTLIGAAALKRQQLLFSNLLEIISGAIILIAGIAILAFL